MLALLYALFLLATVGHVVLWVALLNRLHAVAIPRPVLDVTDKPHLVILASAPLLVLMGTVIEPQWPRIVMGGALDYWWLWA